MSAEKASTGRVQQLQPMLCELSESIRIGSG